MIFHVVYQIYDISYVHLLLDLWLHLHLLVSFFPWTSTPSLTGTQYIVLLSTLRLLNSLNWYLSLSYSLVSNLLVRGFAEREISDVLLASYTDDVLCFCFVSPVIVIALSRRNFLVGIYKRKISFGTWLTWASFRDSLEFFHGSHEYHSPAERI